MNKTEQTKVNIVEPSYTVYVDICQGPLSYATLSGSITETITSVNLDAIAERNEVRFQKAWRELAGA